MNRDHQPCGMCARFPPASAKDEGVERSGYCEGWEKDVLSIDRPCVLFNLRGSWATRKALQPPEIKAKEHFARERNNDHGRT